MATSNILLEAKKAKYTKKASDNVYQLYHFETDTNQVLLDKDLTTDVTGVTGIETIEHGTTLQSALQKIKNVADTGGEAANNIYDHASNTNNPHKVTKAQVGLGSVENRPMDSSPISGSERYVTSGGVYTAIDNVDAKVINAVNIANNALSIAQGRSSAHVFSSLSFLKAGKTNAHVGDSIFVTETNVPDFWICNLAGQHPAGWENSTDDEIRNAKDGEKVYLTWGSSYVTLCAIEVKVNLEDYSTSAEIEDRYVRKDLAAAFSSDDITGYGSFNGGFSLSLTASGITAGTYSAVTVDSKGRATKGWQSIVFASSLQDDGLASLVVGGVAVIG